MVYRSVWWVLAAVLLGAALPGVTQGTRSRVAFQCDGLHNDPANIRVMFTDGTHYQDLAPNPDLPGARVTPALSPDGRTIAFSAKVGEHFRLFTWSLDDQNNTVGTPVRVTPDENASAKFPAWSPDGTRLAFLGIDENGKVSLRVINADGTGLKEVVPSAYFATPSWTPDGLMLLYLDRDKGKSVLKSVPVTGGAPLPIQPTTEFITACFSPDGKQIAALRKAKDDLADLLVMHVTGTGAKVLVSKIAGGRSVAWPASDKIIFNASKVGKETGKAFWTIGLSGGTPKGLTGYANPKQIAFFSVQQSKATDVPTVVDVPINPPTGPTGPKERVPTGPVTIVRPFDDTSVHGAIPVKIIAQRGVTSIVLRINNQFTYAAAPQTDNAPVPAVTFTWDTQEFLEFDPARAAKLPATYAEGMRYPDGTYTLSVQAMKNDPDRPTNLILVGKDSITVTVQNTLPASTLPGDATLKYKFAEKSPDELYTIRGEGLLYGVNTDGQTSKLFASLNATLRRTIVQAQPFGGGDLRLFINEPRDGSLPLRFGSKETTIPELDVSALTTLSSNGDMTVKMQQLQRVYLPLAQVAIPYLPLPTPVGATWSNQMWVVADLLDREAAFVRANHQMDGVEWLNDRRAARVRSEFVLTGGSSLSLALTPTATAPGLRGTKGMGVPPAAPEPGAGATIVVPSGDPRLAKPDGAGQKQYGAYGVRYSWFDFERNVLMRVEDFILYHIPQANLPGTAGVGSGDAWYLVRYSYTLQDNTLKANN